MIELLRKRRSIRKYTNEKIDVESRNILIEAALRAPSARGINPWEFILVDDQELILQLSQAKQFGSAFLINAPFAIVVCGDSSKADFWIEDCSITATIIQLTAASLGLGSCWIQIRNRQHNDNTTAEAYVQELLGLPEHIKVSSILAIGYPDEIKPTVSAENLQYDKIKENRWV